MLIIVFPNIIMIEKHLITFLSDQSILNKIFDDLDKVNNLNPQKESIKEKKINVHDKVSESYNNF